MTWVCTFSFSPRRFMSVLSSSLSDTSNSISSVSTCDGVMDDLKLDLVFSIECRITT